jgi:hypothetical protein
MKLTLWRVYSKSKILWSYVYQLCDVGFSLVS